MYCVDKIKNVIIYDGVTSIGSGQFYECYNLESIVIPESVTSIGFNAFDGCTKLASVTIPENVTSMGEYVFNGWTSLQTIYVKGYTETPTSWDSNWEKYCDATIIFG